MDQLAGLTEEAQKLALDRFHLLQPHLEDDRPLKAVAAAAGIPFRTAQRWVSLYRQFGLTALGRKRRTDTGQHREMSAKLKEAIEGIALQKPPIPVAAICRQARRLAQDLGEEPPSYWLVYRIVDALPADLVTLAHEGTKAYSNAFELVHRREADRPNAIWQADHTRLDILLIRPDGAAAKPWLTTVIDDHSRAVAGYFLSFEDPSALHTSMALRQAIWRNEDSRWIVCGIPAVLYTDNGSDFTSQHLEQVGADLKMRLVFSIPGKPRGRGRIERFFSTVNQMFLCELDGYAPAGGVVRGKPALTLAEFDKRFRAFLMEVYHRRENAETKMPPVERWEANGFLLPPLSSDTGTSDHPPSTLVETLEHRRFAEFWWKQRERAWLSGNLRNSTVRRLDTPSPYQFRITWNVATLASGNMTPTSLVAFVLLAMPAFADQTYISNSRFGNIPDGAKPAAFAADPAGSFYVVSNITEPSGRPQNRVDKLDANGSSIANFEFGGSDQDSIAGVAIDPAGNVVIAGTTLSPDFPLVSPVASTPETIAAFIVKIDPQLKNILFSTKLGGTQSLTSAGALALDKLGNIYVTGLTEDADFPTTPGAFQTQPPQPGPSGTAIFGFVTAIASSGTAITFSSYFGASAAPCVSSAGCVAAANVGGTAIALDAEGNVIIAGYTTANQLPVTSGAFGPNCGACTLGASAGFAAKFSLDGSRLLWATYVPAVTKSGFVLDVQITSLAVDAAGDVIIGGGETAENALDVPISSPVPAGPGFVIKLDSGAQNLLFSTYFGEQGQADLSLTPNVGALAVDSQGVVWITGDNYLAGISPGAASLTPIFTAPPGIAGVGIALTASGVTSLGASGELLTASPGQGASLVGIANSAGFVVSKAVAPYELVSFYGLGIGPQTQTGAQVVNGVVGNSLNGVQVLFNGIPAPLLSVGPNQIDAIVPGEIYLQNSVAVQIITPSGALMGPTMQVRPSQPGVFLSSTPNSNLFPSAAAVLNQDGTVNSAANPAAMGSLVSVWLTGAGVSYFSQPDGTIITSTSPPILPVAAFSESTLFLNAIFGGFALLPPAPLSLEVVYAGDAFGMVDGVSQVNFRLPANDGIGSTNIGFFLQIGDASTELFTLYLKAPQ